ncbi:MAG: hypothetical protein ACYSOZ_02395, partial [Planctomycetota bacterium]
IVIVAIAIITTFQNFEVSELLPYSVTMFMILLFVISFAWFVSRKKKKINKDPLYSFAFMMYILIILTVALPLISYFEKEKLPEWFFAILFLTMSMTTIYTVLKHQQKRIDALEEKLNEQNQSKE